MIPANNPSHHTHNSANKRFILVLVHHQTKHHWTIAQIDIHNHQIYHYNSLKSMAEDVTEESLRRLASSLAKMRKKQPEKDEETRRSINPAPWYLRARWRRTPNDLCRNC